MGYAKKRWLVEELQPDVAVLPEVSQKHVAETDAPFKAWVGSNPHKGLGVIGFTDRSYLLHEAGRLLPWHIPFTVDGVNMVALWAHVRDKDLRYVRVTHEIVDRHADFLTSAPSLLIGDFNSNTIWDREHPGRNHSLLVDKLHGLGLRSVHHGTEDITHGSESTKPTSTQRSCTSDTTLITPSSAEPQRPSRLAGQRTGCSTATTCP